MLTHSCLYIVPNWVQTGVYMVKRPILQFISHLFIFSSNFSCLLLGVFINCFHSLTSCFSLVYFCPNKNIILRFTQFQDSSYIIYNIQQWLQQLKLKWCTTKSLRNDQREIFPIMLIPFQAERYWGYSLTNTKSSELNLQEIYSKQSKESLIRSREWLWCSLIVQVKKVQILL